MRDEKEKSKTITLGTFLTEEEAKVFEEEIKYQCWVVYTVERRLDA